MPLPSEVAYWEGVARKLVTDEGALRKDNVHKRPHQLRRLLEYCWIDQRVLEIGTGNSMVAGALKVIIQGHWKYIGTELSASFRKAAKEMFFLETVEADVREIPGEGYTRIIALDSLEHVRPEHRLEGYAKIASVAAPDALLFIHLSRSESFHDPEFDHPFGLRDLAMLEDVGFVLNSYDRYKCDLPDRSMDYAFVVMQKCA